MVEFRAIHNTNTFKKITSELLQKIKRNELQVYGTQVILTIKTNVKEEISHSKVQVVVQGYTMRKGVDYDSTLHLWLICHLSAY
jgi:DNA polymerase III sliding clamp (beta) subunit (PCNA family)